MYKVLIVDDKPWIIEDIKRIVDWNALGFEIVGTALNGNTAMELVGEKNPDIIISDIEIPDFNGFELLSGINKKQRSIVTIFISAYDKFSYAREAISLGAFEYLLKPVEKDVLIKVLEKAVAEVERRRREFDNRAALLLLSYINDYTQNTKEEVSFFKMLNDIGYSTKSKNFAAGIIKANGRIDISAEKFRAADIDFYCVPVGKSRYAFFAGYRCSKNGSDPLTEKLQEWCRRAQITVGISTISDQRRNVMDLFNQANIAVEQDFITGQTNKVYFYTKSNTLPICRRIAQLASVEEVYSFIKNLRQELTDHNITIEGLSDVCDKLLHKLPWDEDRANTLVLPDAKSYVEAYADVTGIITALLDSGRQYSSAENIANALINEVVFYIKKNYNSRILIQDIAKQFNVNSNYLSMLFKNVCGKSFTSYLIELRLEKAKELLKDNSLSLYEIGEKVGYDDYFHFSKIFKKYNGVSPANYRKQLDIADENT